VPLLKGEGAFQVGAFLVAEEAALGANKVFYE
jgi:hypothetical protein